MSCSLGGAPIWGPGDQYLPMPVLVIQRSTSAETGNNCIVAVVLPRSPGGLDAPAPAASTPHTVNIMSCRSSNASGKDFRKTKQRTTCYVFIGIHRSAQGFRHRQLLGFITGNDPVLSLAFSLVLVHSGLSGPWKLFPLITKYPLPGRLRGKDQFGHCIRRQGHFSVEHVRHGAGLPTG